METAFASSVRIMREAVEAVRPDYIVSMVSGGKDSAASHAVAVELGLKIDLIIHGNTRTGIAQTSQFVTDHYGNCGPDLAVADAGDAYERYVLKNGFFGKGRHAHNHAYHLLKNQPFTTAISKHLRQRKRGVKIMLLTGIRREESDNRARQPAVDPDRKQPNNVWVKPICEWSASDRDAFLASRNVPLNPVATALCRSGECMCGTMQSKAERIEAAAIYPEWGRWIDALEAEVVAKHGFGWGQPFPRRDSRQAEMFQPMCMGCNRRAEAA